ncbi:Uncharacterised protein [BD1-7 clade bacterium]|uniref:Phage late control D family protein n=1 Tax=BD1-7 clade bacterium TaxID=2029982 RepID=A0A5S9Q3J3_9GAMM|nr:Uncharacterised protein [BD1-7 clade bacterium]CAA0111880.1 Uncharacterised protein [BD1-7 clade bacterium]
MKPLFTLTADNNDITAKISDRLLSLAVIDERGTDSDTLTVRLDDRNNVLALIPTGAVLKVELGYQEQSGKITMYPMGRFTVDEVELEGPPDTLIIRARAADLRKSLKQQKTRTWKNTTMADVIGTIAAEHDLTGRISEPLANIEIPHLAQTDESDLHLITRLAKEYDAIAKPTNGYLLFVVRGEAKSVNGTALPEEYIHRSQCSRWRVVLADRSKYEAVIAHWHDTETGQRVPERVGTGEPVFTLRGTKPTQQAARDCAAAKLNALKRGAAIGDLEIEGGLLSVMAESPIITHGFRTGIDDIWIADRVEHRLEGRGLTSSIDIEAPKK